MASGTITWCGTPLMIPSSYLEACRKAMSLEPRVNHAHCHSEDRGLQVLHPAVSSNRTEPQRLQRGTRKHREMQRLDQFCAIELVNGRKMPICTLGALDHWPTSTGIDRIVSAPGCPKVGSANTVSANQPAVALEHQL